LSTKPALSSLSLRGRSFVSNGRPSSFCRQLATPNQDVVHDFVTSRLLQKPLIPKTGIIDYWDNFHIHMLTSYLLPKIAGAPSLFGYGIRVSWLTAEHRFRGSESVSYSEGLMLSECPCFYSSVYLWL